jgi:excisionase family DNA binding protein
MTQQLIRLSKVYKQLGISRGVAYRWAREGKMPAFNLNGTWLVDTNELNSWIHAGHNSSPPPPATAHPLYKQHSHRSLGTKHQVERRPNGEAVNPAVRLFERELARLRAKK